MKNIERIFFYTVLIIVIAIMGVLIYEKINNNDTVDLLNEHIAELESDRDKYIAELDIIRAGTIKLQDTLKEFEQDNIKLKSLLDQSSKITGEAEEENRAVTAGIDRALEIVRRIKADYQRQ